MPEMISLDQITTDDTAQIRAFGTNQEVVGEYADALENGAELPPVVVFRDGDNYFAGDGFHRIAAARKLGRDAIAADVRQGTLRDAILHAAGANATHGLRRTNADKRKAVSALLTDPLWTKWSDRKIATACSTDHKTVAAVRRELSGEIPKPTAKKKPNGEIPKSGNGEIPTLGSSMVAKLFATVSDEALVAECRRRGLEVSP